MTHWSEAYVGREHVDGVYDCASLVVDVLRERYGKKVNIPAERIHYESGKNFNADIDFYKFSLCEPVETPEDGDVVLMHSMNHLSHIGIYVLINNVPYVLHNLAKRNTCLHKVRELSKYHLKVEGFYRLKDEPLKDELENDGDHPQSSSPASSG